MKYEVDDTEAMEFTEQLLKFEGIAYWMRRIRDKCM